MVDKKSILHYIYLLLFDSYEHEKSFDNSMTNQLLIIFINDLNYIHKNK